MPFSGDIYVSFLEGIVWCSTLNHWGRMPFPFWLAHICFQSGWENNHQQVMWKTYLFELDSSYFSILHGWWHMVGFYQGVELRPSICPSFQRHPDRWKSLATKSWSSSWVLIFVASLLVCLFVSYWQMKFCWLFFTASCCGYKMVFCGAQVSSDKNPFSHLFRLRTNPCDIPLYWLVNRDSL